MVPKKIIWNNDFHRLTLPSKIKSKRPMHKAKPRPMHKKDFRKKRVIGFMAKFYFLDLVFYSFGTNNTGKMKL